MSAPFSQLIPVTQVARHFHERDVAMLDFPSRWYFIGYIARAMRRTTPFRMSLVATVFVLAACSKRESGSSGAPPVASVSAATVATPVSSPAVAASAGACDVVSCLNFNGAPGYAAGKEDALPSVPPPPSGSSICGGSTSMHVNYYTTAQSPDAVVTYYEKELAARGFTLRPRQPGTKPCALDLGFRKAGLQIGHITAFVGGFGVMYLGK